VEGKVRRLHLRWSANVVVGRVLRTRHQHQENDNETSGQAHARPISPRMSKPILHNLLEVTQSCQRYGPRLLSNRGPIGQHKEQYRLAIENCSTSLLVITSNVPMSVPATHITVANYQRDLPSNCLVAFVTKIQSSDATYLIFALERRSR